MIYQILKSDRTLPKMNEDLPAEICKLLNDVAMSLAEIFEKTGQVPPSASLVVFSPVEGVMISELPGSEIFFTRPGGTKLLGLMIRATLGAASDEVPLGVLTVAEAWAARASDDPALKDLAPSERPDRSECVSMTLAMKGGATFMHSLDIVSDPKRRVELRAYEIPSSMVTVWSRFSDQERPPRDRMH